MQTTFELLLWLLSAETCPELSLVSGGGAVTAGVPRDCTTRGFLLLLGLGPLFLCGLGASGASELVLAGLCDAPFTAAAAAAASAAAFNKAIVWDFGRRPRTPLRTGRGGKGLGSLYEVCMEEEELEEERRAVREVEEEETGARSAPGRVTGNPDQKCRTSLLQLRLS